jgi:hypothetical protein
MSTFSSNVLKLLNSYKRLLRRYVSPAEREKTIVGLGIKRKSLKLDNEVILYNKVQRVIKDIEYWIKKLNCNAVEYSGINEFYNHIKAYFDQYRVEKDKVIHITQKVSCALVHAIQIISMSTLSDTHTSQLDNCIKTIIQFGTTDQKTMLANTLQKAELALKENLLKPLRDSLVIDNPELPTGVEKMVDS